MKASFVGISFFLIPSLAFAAGFAKQSIFLSTSAPVEGQTVLIHASVSNPTSSKFTGSLKFRDEASSIGSAPVTLDAGAADDVSVSWKPTAGTHTIVADLVDSTGTTVEEDTQIFNIAEDPNKIKASASQNETGGVQSSAQIQNSIANVSPTAEQYTKPVFSAIDSGRAFAAHKLNDAIAWSKQTAGIPTSTKGFVFKNAPDASKGWTAWSMLGTVSLYILTVLLYIVSNAGIFYPVFAILILYLLWKGFKRFRRA